MRSRTVAAILVASAFATTMSAQTTVTTAGGTSSPKTFPIFNGSSTIIDSPLAQDANGNLMMNKGLTLGDTAASCDMLRVKTKSTLPSWANTMTVLGGNHALIWRHAPVTGTGMAGLLLEKNSADGNETHAISWSVDLTAKWGMGLDAGNKEFVPLYMFGRGDIFRFKSTKFDCLVSGAPRYSKNKVFGVLAAQGVGSVELDCDNPDSTPALRLIGVKDGMSALFQDGGANYVNGTDVSDGWETAGASLAFVHKAVYDPQNNEVVGGDNRIVANGRGQTIRFYTDGTAMPHANVDPARERMKIGTTSELAVEIKGGLILNPIELNNQAQLVQVARPTCDAEHRGQFWYTRNTSYGADTLAVCIATTGDPNGTGSGYTWKSVTLQ